MRITTYFEPHEGWWGPAFLKDNEALLDLWKRSWREHGWEPTVTTLKDAERHPKFEALSRAIQRFPTRSPAEAHRAGFLRWLTLPVAGGGWTSDIDVINYGFRPEDVPQNCERVSAGSSFLWNYSRFETTLGYERLIDHLLNTDPEETAEFFMGGPHLSDLVALRSLPTDGVVFLDVEKIYSEPGWETAPLVHYCSGTLPPGQTRFEFVVSAR